MPPTSSRRFSDEEDEETYLGEEGEEDDDLFQEDMDALKRACMLQPPSTSSSEPCASDVYTEWPPVPLSTEKVREEEHDDDDIDDFELVRGISLKFNFPIDLGRKSPGGSSAPDLNEDDFETLRAIQRRFEKYESGDQKENIGEHWGNELAVSDVRFHSSENDNCTSSFAGRSLGNEECSNFTGQSTHNSSFPKCARLFVEALKKNRLNQRLIRDKLVQLELMIGDNKEFRRRLKCMVNLQQSCKRNATRIQRLELDARLKLISVPTAKKNARKVKDEKLSPACFGPVMNSFVPIFKSVISKHPSYMQRKPWSKAECENLLKGVKQQLQEFLLFDSMKRNSEGCEAESNYLSMIMVEIKNLEITSEHVSSFSAHVDWDQLAAMYLKGRSGKECQARWFNSEDPFINRNPWTKFEEKKLLVIVQERGLCDWINITKMLGTGRTPSQCLIRYQRSLNAYILKKEWSKDDDAQLRAAVKTYGEKDWQVIASHLEGRTGFQCSNRWRKSLHPGKKRVGRWTIDEDKHLKIAVMFIGPRHWNKIAVFVSGRTQEQCRERWMNVLDPSINLGQWTSDEDFKLRAAIDKYGYSWSKVAACVPARTDSQCRRRWRALYPDEHRQAQLAYKIKKEALITNFVDRKKERPAVGPDDFLPALDDYPIDPVKDCAPRKRKSRKSTGSSKKKHDDPSTCHGSKEPVAEVDTETNGMVGQSLKSKPPRKNKKRKCTEVTNQHTDADPGGNSHDNEEIAIRERKKRAPEVNAETSDVVGQCLKSRPRRKYQSRKCRELAKQRVDAESGENIHDNEKIAVCTSATPLEEIGTERVENVCSGGEVGVTGGAGSIRGKSSTPKQDGKNRKRNSRKSAVQCNEDEPLIQSNPVPLSRNIVADCEEMNGNVVDGGPHVPKHPPAGSFSLRKTKKQIRQQPIVATHGKNSKQIVPRRSQGSIHTRKPRNQEGQKQRKCCFPQGVSLANTDPVMICNAREGSNATETNAIQRSSQVHFKHQEHPVMVSTTCGGGDSEPPLGEEIVVSGDSERNCLPLKWPRLLVPNLSSGNASCVPSLPSECQENRNVTHTDLDRVELQKDSPTFSSITSSECSSPRHTGCMPGPDEPSLLKKVSSFEIAHESCHQSGRTGDRHTGNLQPIEERSGAVVLETSGSKKSDDPHQLVKESVNDQGATRARRKSRHNTSYREMLKGNFEINRRH